MWFALLMVLLAPAKDSGEAEQLFHAMEAKLDKAESIDLSFDIKIEEGEVAGFPKGTELKGTLAVMHGNKLRLELGSGEVAKPESGEEPFKALWMSDGKQSILSVAGEGKPQPTEPRKDFAVGYVTVVARPGVLMSQLPLPDVAFANHKERFIVSDFTLGGKEKIGERETQQVHYKIALPGQDGTFSITVWIDVKSGLPAMRRVTGGEDEEKLVYSETYDLTLDEKLDAKLFEVPE